MTMRDAPLEPITEDLVLAAIARGERHRQRVGAPMWVIKDHLAAPARSRRAREVNALVSTLADVGLLKSFREHSQTHWTLTESAKVRMLRGFDMTERLPESPQHVRWREAHRIAGQELERYREVLRAVLAEAAALLDAPGDATASDTWFQMGRRLQRNVERVGSATYCLYEWQEPSDDVADIESERERGHRNPGAWGFMDEAEAGARRLTPEEFEEHFGHLLKDGEG
jgi:hypothetical protein